MSTKERPILFSGPMIRAILAGAKTQTRRVVKLPLNERPWHFIECSHSAENCNDFIAGFSDRAGSVICIKCPYGKPADPSFDRPADRLWVRETWAVQHEYDSAAPSEIGASARWHYAATEDLGGLRKRPSIFLPRRGSRILLEITDVRVERLQEISDDDARLEGYDRSHAFPREWFARLWASINGADSWNANPWVWVVSFRMVDGGVVA
jgi:hypothetical protein